jgi:hypothetical protein
MRRSWPSSTAYAILAPVLFATAAGYPAWVLTAEVLGKPASGPGVLAILLNAVVGIGAPAWFGWAVYRNHRTTFDNDTISQPGLRGPKVVRWADVVAVRQEVAGLHVSDGRTTIVIAPFAFRQPTQVYADVVARVPSGLMGNGGQGAPRSRR